VNRTRRVAVAVVATAAALAAPLAWASPALAEPHTVTVTVGPVSAPGVPVSACVDSTCASTPAVTELALTASVTADAAASSVLLEPVACPTGSDGAAVRVSTSTTVTVRVSATLSGTGPEGPVLVTVGPKTHTLSASTPGVVVSSCTA